MSPTLADLLAEPSLALSCVVGHRHLHRSVSWVHVSEVEDPTPWLTPGVLLLVTGMIPRDEDELDLLFSRLAASAVAGVGFGVGLIVEEIPESWIRAAERHEIPLLRVPLDTPYLAISEFVSHRIAEVQLAQVTRLLDVQQRLAYSESRTALQLEALEALADELDATILWRDDDGLARTEHGALRPGPGERAALAEELTRHASSGLRSTSVSIARLYIHVASTAGLPIAVVRDRRYTPLEQGLIGSIATFIDLTRETALVPGFTSSFREQILSAAISGTIHPDPELFEILIPHVAECVVARLGPFPDSRVISAREPAAGLLLKAHLASSITVNGRPASPLLCGDEDGFTLVVPGTASETLELAVDSFLRQESGNLGTWRAGVSTDGRPSALPQLCSEARQAQQATAVRPEQRALRYAHLSRRERTQVWLPASLDAPILELWRDRFAELSPAAAARIRDALTAFLGENGGIERASATLGVHRQTLKARLREAEQRLEVSLDSPTERALLWLAIESGALAG